MVLPVIAYGHPVLRKICEDVDSQYPELKKLIEDMWETMYHTNGVGIAAPQVGKAIRVFVIDTNQVVDDFDDEDRRLYPNEKPYKGVFINAEKIEETGTPWAYNEGCLSIPKVREDVRRPASVTIEFLNANFENQTMTFHGITARVILHEYDHIEGKLFIDYLPALKKRLIRKKLDDISTGKVKVDYRMVFPK